MFDSADIFVFPGVQQEGQPLVVIEAMGAGLPVIFTDGGCLRDTVPDGEAGLEVPINNPQKLADPILWLLDHPEALKTIGATPELLRLVLRVCERAGSREGVYRASAQLGRVTTAPERAGALLASAARICDRELGRPEEAAPLHRLALGALPRERELAARLVEICVAAGARGSLAELYTHLITYGDEADRVRWLLERAQLSEARSELRAATEDYEAVLGLDARHEEALYRLGRLRESGKREPAA